MTTTTEAWAVKGPDKKLVPDTVASDVQGCWGRALGGLFFKPSDLMKRGYRVVRVRIEEVPNE